jgi:hypothetical protein
VNGQIHDAAAWEDKVGNINWDVVFLNLFPSSQPERCVVTFLSF